MLRTVLVSLLVATAPAALAAQLVGHPPTSSPFRDYPMGQDLGVFGGWFGGNTGQAGVGPKGAATVGVRYSFHIGGPALFVASVQRIASQRRVIDPRQSGAARDLGTHADPLYLAEGGLDVALTGQKSWHSLIPSAGVSAGAVRSNSGGDIGGYSFGTTFALGWGLGLQFVPKGNLSLRMDVRDHFWQLGYPSVYFATPTGGGTPVLTTSRNSQNEWTHNLTYTFGLSYAFKR